MTEENFTFRETARAIAYGARALPHSWSVTATPEDWRRVEAAIAMAEAAHYLDEHALDDSAGYAPRKREYIEALATYRKTRKP